MVNLVTSPVAGEDWQEEKGNSLRFKWDIEGFEVVGKLLSIKEVPGVNSTTAQEATLLTSEGKKRFFLTIDLEEKLSVIPIGSEIKIKYLGKQRSPRGMMVKKFTVFSRNKPTPDKFEGKF